MNTMDEEIVNSLIKVASRYDSVLIIEEREEKLRRQNLLKNKEL